MKRFLVLGVLAATTACSGSEEDGPTSDVTASRRALLDSMVDRVILPAYGELDQAASAMVSAASSFASDPSEANRTAAQEAFYTLSDAVQMAELMQVGPYGSASKFAGGEGLRDEVYSWPLVNPCRVDQELVEANYDVPGYFDGKLVNVYGMDALEYLLFTDRSDNACPASQAINVDGSWSALAADPAELSARRAAYAAAVASRLRADVQRLEAAWSGGFGDELRSAGDGSSTYRTSQQAMDELFAAMFYLEKSVKDSKLGAPLGITAACMEASCPDLLESQHAHRSVEWVRANVRAFQLMFHGGDADDPEAFGFDDLLGEAGAPDLATEMAGHLSDALGRADGMAKPLRDHLESADATALHGDLRELATLLKTQFVSVLALRVPSEGAADND